MMESLGAFAISLLIGLLIGIEREKSHPAKEQMGVRTFSLVALLGACAGWVQETWLAVLLGGFTVLLIVLSYAFLAYPSKEKRDFGLTTEVAAGIVFFLGYFSHRDYLLVSLLGCVVALLLFSKRSLHRFTAKIRPSELQAVILLLLIGLSVLSLLEDKAIGPWNLFNPRKLGMLVLILAVLEFSSYLATKFLSEKKSPLVIGFFGGLVSSTAMVMSSARRSKQESNDWKATAATALTATLSSILEVILIVGFISLDLLLPVSLLLIPALILGGITALWLAKGIDSSDRTSEVRSPLDLKGVLRLALLLGAILIAIAAAQKFMGDSGTKFVAFFTGLFELHGVTLATATLFDQNQITKEVSLKGFELALLASLLAKIALCWLIHRGTFSKALTFIFTILGATIFLTALLLPSLPMPW